MKNFKRQSRKQRGFTLIEIAIVLVIIGLLLGGVLQGQQLIENSRVKSATNDFNGLAAAAFSYQDRYGRLPGDDPGGIDARGDSWPATTGGDGDGVITAPAAGAFDGGGEVSLFFSNLRSAGFIAGNPAIEDSSADLPQNPFGGLITIVSGSTLGGLNGLKVCMGGVNGTSAIALDTQLDDGLSISGRFRATESTTGDPAEDPVAAAANYSEDSMYTVCYRI